MRIVAGQLGGRSFVSPRGHRTRPMSQKLRGALFNTLGDISGLTVLDAFAGSGAVGYEAASRGAAHVTAIDADKSAQNAVVANISALALNSKIKLIKAKASAWLKTTNNRFDIVILDPPYDDLQPNLLQQLAERANPNGVVVLSLPPNANISLPGNFEQLSAKSYGDANLLFYRRTS